MIIKNLAFSGGGSKCLSYIGCLKYFSENKLLDNLQRVIGTSGGSIFSLVIVLDYDYEDIKNLALGLNLNSLKDISVENIFQFFTNYGIDTGKKLEKLIKLLIRKKCENENITFLDLFKLTGIEFTVTGMCVNTSMTEYFNYLNTPNMEVWLAIRISCSIPIIYNYVKINEKTYIDGGALDNYPIEYFKDDLDNTYGFYINDKNSKTNKIKSLDRFMFNILVAMNKRIESMILEKYQHCSVKIDCDINGINFNLDNTEKQKLIDWGYKNTSEYFDKIIVKKTLDDIINKIVSINFLSTNII